MRKLLRTRSADQLRSAVGTLQKTNGAVFARRPISVAISANVTARTIGWGRSPLSWVAGRRPDAADTAAGQRIRRVHLGRRVHLVHLVWGRYGSRRAAVDGKRAAHARRARSS